MKEEEYIQDIFASFNEWTVVDMKMEELPISIVSQDESKVICQCFQRGIENKKNAQLMSAAPNLLKALQNIMGIIDTPIARRKMKSDSFYLEAIQIARSALEKALKE